MRFVFFEESLWKYWIREGNRKEGFVYIFVILMSSQELTRQEMRDKRFDNANIMDCRVCRTWQNRREFNNNIVELWTESSYLRTDQKSMVSVKSICQHWQVVIVKYWTWWHRNYSFLNKNTKFKPNAADIWTDLSSAMLQTFSKFFHDEGSEVSTYLYAIWYHAKHTLCIPLHPVILLLYQHDAQSVLLTACLKRQLWFLIYIINRYITVSERSDYILSDLTILMKVTWTLAAKNS